MNVLFRPSYLEHPRRKLHYVGVTDWLCRRHIIRFLLTLRHSIPEILCIFLSDPSPIIGNACHSLTHSLTDCCLVNLIDVTLMCEDANSKLVEVVTVADVTDEDHVGNSSLQIWELTFGHKAKLLFRL